MFDQQINEQLGGLQKELSRLKKATQYIENAKENSDIIMAELEKIQQNYVDYIDGVFTLYRQYVDELKKNIETQINNGVLKFENTGNKIDITNKEKLTETKRLIEQYKKIAEATDSLIEVIGTINFPERLDHLDASIQFVNASVNESRKSMEKNIAGSQELLMRLLFDLDANIKNTNALIGEMKLSIEKNMSDSKVLLLKKFDQQYKEIKSIRMLLYFIFVLIVIGVIVVIFILK
ncbi:MAG TPA: hypothetical protein PKC76_13485 [Saprospiraceae bacterium]|nr:hypothetical protein [Saprospiraceae bacterium]HMP25146.1 hypothetical protein [Saprospiraceae bacterium]